MGDCVYCLQPRDAADHAYCRAISDLAAFRGIPFAEAAKQLEEDVSIERAEARMVGETYDEPAGDMSEFDIEE